MFNSRIQDNTDKCNIIKHSLLDDLLDYTTTSNGNSVTLQFSDKTSAPVTSRLSEISSLVTDTTTLETWQPLFIENDNLVKTKMLSDYGAHLNANPSLNSGRIGIEDFYTFTPQFKHWDNKGGVMSVDWILNKSNCPYAINYGILGWYRIIDSANSRSIGGTAQPIESFPNGSRLKHASQPDKIYIKISDNILRDITAQPNTLSSAGSWTFNDESTAVLKDVATFGQNATFTLSDIYYERELANPTSSPRKHNLINTLLGGDKNSYLWIPDGDFFSYYYSDSDKQISLAAKIPSCSYISASLYNQYSNIYRIITLDEPRLFDKKDLRKARSYKKLAHILSTSPFVHDFSIHALDYIEIRKIIQKYIDDQKNITTIAQELNSIKTTLLDISKTLQTTIVTNNGSHNTNKGLFLDTKSSFITTNNNLIRNSEQLFKKLLNKYGAKLLVSRTTTLTPKPNTLKYNNDGIVITQVLDSYVSKDTKNTTVYNTQQIVFDQTNIITSTDPKLDNQLSIVNESQTVNVPLVDCVKPGYGTLSNINITLPYKSYVKGEFRTDGVLLEEPGTIDTYIFESDLSGSRGIDLLALDIMPEILSRGEPGIFSATLYLESKIGVIWEQLSGPSGSFQEVNGIPGVSPATKFYTSNTGKFVVQCTASTPFGTYTKIKTFYVIDGRQVIATVANPNYGKYEILNLDGTSKWAFPPDPNPYAAESTPVYLNVDNLRVQTTKINSIGIHNMAGVVWPIRTNLQVREDTGAIGRTRAENIFDLSSDYKFTYVTNYSARTENPALQLIFNNYNTVIKIHSIFLEKIRTNESGCENCTSFYEPKMVARNDIIFLSSVVGENASSFNATRYLRSNKAPLEFRLLKYKLDRSFDTHISFSYPYISTYLAPNIKSYGGYSTNFVNSIIKDPIPEHPLPPSSPNDTIASTQSPILPKVSGYKLDYRNDKNPSLLKMCYQKPLISVPPTGSIMQFTKGVFHPASGWIPYSGNGYQIHANRCGLLKFNPGARDSFSFLGPSLSPIKNRNIDITNNTIDQKIFSSSINLSIAKEVQWDPDCACGSDIDGENPDAGAIGIPRYNDNQKHKEYADIHYHISNHGYRNLAGGVPKQSERTVSNNTSFVNDEFLTEHDAKNSSISYSFAVTGPAIMPTVTTPDGRIMLRNPRVNDFGIKDIEIKLNFLNYVNTKNLVVWLEVDYDSDEQKTRYPPDAKKPSSPLRASQEFLDQSFDANLYCVSGVSTASSLSALNSLNNPTLSNYISALTDMNSNKQSTPLKLYLLNQENIEHNEFNFCVKFSDSTSKYNTPYDTNILPSPTGFLNATPVSPPILNYMLSSGVSFIKNNQNSSQQSIYQTVINNTDSLQPTIAATGYTDRECCLNGSIIKHNKINITNNTFSKFVAKSLFKGTIPTTLGPCDGGAVKQKQPDFNGHTTFTLKMMVLDETDDMYPNDNIDYQYKEGLDTTNNDSLSCSILNSLCNWELILHVGPVHKPLPHTSPSVASYGNTDILSLINYDTDPQYPGYSFIADLSAHKHLLPLANLNAPYSCVADHHTCLSSDGFIAAGALSLRPPEFPAYAILQIMASITAAAGLNGGTLVGVLGGLDSIINNPGWNDIYNFFRENRFVEQLIDASRELHAPMYHKYPFGSPEKMLVLFRKAQGLWYNAEATIMKYHNTPILKPNRYKFIKVQRGNGKYISEFKYKIINDFNDLIDKNNIKKLDCACGDWGAVSAIGAPVEYSGLLMQKGDLVEVNLVPSTQAGCSGHNGLYLIPPDANSWIKITESNLDQLSKAIHFSTQNAVLCGGKPFFDSSLSLALKDNKAIVSPSRIPYDLFSINDTIESYTQGDSAASVSLSVVNKALLFKDNKYFSVFLLDKSAASGNTLSPSSGDHVFFVFDNKTSIEDRITKQYNIWGLDQNKELVGSQITNIQPNAHSAGSYGDLSLFLEKNLLSSNIRYNHLEKYHTIFNNKMNDKLKYNQIKVFDKDNVAQTGFKSQSCYGFAYSETDLKANIFDTKNLSTYITPEYFRPDGDTSELFADLDHELKLSSSTENEISYRYGYIKAKVGNQDSALPTGVLYGELTIENDFIEHIPMRILTQEEIAQLQNRLLLIDDDKFTGVDNSIGTPENTTTVLQSNNLQSVLKHHKSLPDDPSHCYRPNDKKSNLCYKKQTEQKINDLYLERKEIIDLLDYQTVRMISLSYTDSNNATERIDGEILYENNSYITIKPLSATTSTKIAKNSIVTTTPITRTFKSRTTLPITHPKWISDSILPKISPTIKTDTTTQAITITYDAVNTDHYWINIDPKQSTFKDFEKNPRILVDTTYICQLANPSLVQTPVMKNNVCPFSSSADLPVGWDANLDISFKQDSPTSYTYSVHPRIIDEKKGSLKSLYPSIKDWKPFTKIRYFNINGDQTLDTAPALEIIVQARENYLVPITDEDLGTLEYDDMSADTSSVNGIQICPAGSNQGSTSGYGLLTTYGERLGKPTRVCNIINLDNTNNIDVMVKRIPRILRGVDLLATIYRYGSKSIYRQSNPNNPSVPTEIDLAAPNGAINNSLYYWTCYQTNPNTKLLEQALLPNFFLLQNEMMFRAFFGSIDKIENRIETAVSSFPWELIPYEYSQPPE